MTPRAVIAEDEPLLAGSLRTGLAFAWPELQIAGVAPNGIEALRLIEAERPDVAFLDIRMPGLSGLEVAAELADHLEAGVPAPLLVFITAYDEFALRAFELAAVDYLLKPVDADRLGRTVRRLQQLLAAGPRPDADDFAQLVARVHQAIDAGSVDSRGAPLHTIRAAVGNSVRMVPVEDVCYFQAADKYTSVITHDAELLIRTPLKELMAQLPPETFRQIHRSTIVNLSEVAAAIRDESGRISLRLKNRKELLPVSRVFADLFRPQ